MIITVMMAGAALSTTLTKEAVYLYEKDPCTWQIVDGGAWGCLQYRPAYKTFAFWFGAMYLEPCTDYTLVYYPNWWPAKGLICLGEGTTDAQGRIHICGTPNIGDLPKKYDWNWGAKIRLVLSSDVGCCKHKMIGWHPREYLFEDTLITYYDTDD